jgi:hypothetical protein
LEELRFHLGGAPNNYRQNDADDGDCCGYVNDQPLLAPPRPQLTLDIAILSMLVKHIALFVQGITRAAKVLITDQFGRGGGGVKPTGPLLSRVS